MAKKPTVKPVPEGYHTLTPHLIVKDGAKAMEFYKKAFGAVEKFRMCPPGKDTICHAELTIGDSHLMLCEECLEWGAKSPQTLGGTATSVHVYVNDVDAFFKKAVKAGATPEREPAEMFWGDKHGSLVDPFGHRWGVAQHTRDLTQEQIEEGYKTFLTQMEKAPKQPVTASKK